MTWDNRITGEGEVPPDELLANPHNWRIHPKHQQDALERVLESIGWVQRVIVNERTGHVVDGHARVMLALRREEPTIPVLYVDLSEDEEKLTLASFDAIAGLAQTDEGKLRELLASMEPDNELADLLASLHPDQAGDDDDGSSGDGDEPPPDTGSLGVLVTFSDEAAQAAGYDELVSMGYTIKVVNT